MKGKGNFVSPDGTKLRARRLVEIGEEIRGLVKTARELGVDEETLKIWIEKGAE